MRNNLSSRVKLGVMARFLPGVLVLAMTPVVMAATAPIVFSGLETSPFGGTGVFQSATSVATDALGNLYVSEPSQNRVSRVAPDGTVTVLTFTAPLSLPRGLVVDSTNNLWVANNGGTTLIRHPLGGGADAILPGFNQPINMTIDAAGSLYVSSTGGGSRVDKVTGCGAGVAGCVITPLVTTGLGGGVRGLAVDTADNLFIAIITANVLDVSATTGAPKGAFSPCKPRDVAVNPAGDLFIACNDLQPPNNASLIYRIPNEGGTLTPADQSLVATSGITSGGVHGLAFGVGTLYATNGTTIVEKIQLDAVNVGAFLIGAPNATLATTVTLNFSAITTSTLGPVTAYSEGIAQSDATGPADYRIAAAGTTCPLGGGSFGAGSTCTLTLNFFPVGVGVRHGGVVFNGPLQPLFTLPVFGTGLGSRVAYGPGVVNAFAPPVAGVSLNGPDAIQIDGAANRIVTDVLNNRVVKFDSQLQTGSVIGTGLTLPNGVALDGSGNVYIADGALGIVMVPNENGVLNSAHQSIVTTNVSFPAGIRFDNGQNLYVADTFNNRILKIPNEDGQLNGLHAQAIGTGLIEPGGVDPTPDGNVWVADSGNSRVVKIAPDGTQTTVTIDPNQIPGPLDSPTDVVLDAAGDLYISDTNNYRVIYVSADGTVQAVVPGAGTPSQPGYGAFGGLWIDPVGWLYVADVLANHIEQIQNFPFPLAFANTTVGSTSAPQVIETSNVGNVPLNLKSLTFPKDFLQQSVGTAPVLDCSGTTILAPGTSCFIGVAFKPTTAGALSESLKVVDTDLNLPGPAFNTDVFPLSGTALGVLSATPTSLTFPATVAGTVSAPQTVTIQNLSTNSIGLTITITGTNVNAFGVASKTCGATLAGGASCTVSVVFKPHRGANGGRSAQLQVASSVAGGSAVVALQGTATR